MGASNSTKIDTSKYQIQQLKSTKPQQNSTFAPPFRRFLAPINNFQGKKLISQLSLQQPNRQAICYQIQCYRDMQQAFQQKTKNILLENVLVDPQYPQQKLFLGTRLNQLAQPLTLRLNPFSKYTSQQFNNLIYQLNLNQQIKSLNCPKLNCVENSYIIQTGLQSQNQTYPRSIIMQLQPVSTNLNQIIKYRRSNKWNWTINQFNNLCSDLCEALSVLHKNGISHNDIRPANVYYNLKRNCYQLGSFTNSVKNIKQSRNSVRLSMHYTSNQRTQSLQQADIYSLGLTLLSAFYTCEPIDPSKIQPKVNRQFENKYPVLSILRQMINNRGQKNIQNFRSNIPNDGQSNNGMKNFIQSLTYKNAPRQNQKIKATKYLADAYKQLGCWTQWSSLKKQAYQLEDDSLDEYRKANNYLQLAKIQSFRGLTQQSDQFAKNSSKLFRKLGYKAYQSGNSQQSLQLFTKAAQCSKYYKSNFDMQTARNLQGLALVNSDIGQYQLCQPLIKQAKNIINKSAGINSLDYFKLRLTQSKIQSDFGMFDQSQNILHQLLNQVNKKMQSLDSIQMQSFYRVKIQILQQISKDLMLSSSYEQNPNIKKQILNKARQNALQSIQMTQNYQNTQLLMANGLQLLGQIQLRQQNYQNALQNFKTLFEVRKAYVELNPSQKILPRVKADQYTNLAASYNGLKQYDQAIQNYNKALQILQKSFGSNHNKYSAIAIGNMAKVYYRLGDKQKAKDCLIVSTNILKDVVGEQNGDYQHFMGLLQTL